MKLTYSLFKVLPTNTKPTFRSIHAEPSTALFTSHLKLQAQTHLNLLATTSSRR